MIPPMIFLAANQVPWEGLPREAVVLALEEDRLGTEASPAIIP